MKNRFTSLLVILLVAGFSTPLVAQTSDIPGWRGDNRDGKFPGFKVPAVWPKELTKVWETTVGEGDASPALVKGNLYLITMQDSTEMLLCLDAKSGKEVWKTPVNKAPLITGGARTHPGPRSTPTVEDGRVYTLGAGGMVACHDAKNGNLVWKTDAYTKEVPQFFTSASPLLDDGLCILPLGGKENGVLVAFDAKTGKEAWKLGGMPCTYSSPVLMEAGGEIIVNQSETAAAGITLEGKKLWEIPTPGQQRFYNSSTPVVQGQDIYLAGAGTGTHKFTVSRSGDSWTTAEAWTNPGLMVSFNTPVVRDGFLYANDSKFGYIYCLNAATGETAWADTVKMNRFASMLDLGKVMMSLAGNAVMVFFEPSGQAYKELARYKVSDTEVYAHPLAVGNRIWVKDKEKVTCWMIE